MAWRTLTGVRRVVLLGLVALTSAAVGIPAAVAATGDAPPTARCDAPPDAGVGAAGAGAAIEQHGWRLDWQAACVQATLPTRDVDASGDGPGCDVERRAALEVFASSEEVAAQVEASCSDVQPGYAGHPVIHSYDSCRTSFDVTESSAESSCQHVEHSGDGTTWWSSSTTEDRSGISAADDAVTASVSGSEQANGEPSGAHEHRLTVGAEGLAYNYVSNYPQYASQCEDSATLSTSDPMAVQLPTGNCL